MWLWRRGYFCITFAICGEGHQLQVAKANFHRTARVKLQREDPPTVPFPVAQVDRDGTVDLGLHMLPPSDDLVRVPVARFDQVLARLVPQQSAAVLFVQLAPPARTNIGLVSLD